MGLIKQKISLRNPRHPEIAAVETDALVDTGALHLCIPTEIAQRLSLDRLHTRRIGLADGTSKEVPYQGPVVVEALGRECYVGAVVMGDEVLLGSVPLEDMDLWGSPAFHRLVPNPLSPVFRCRWQRVSGQFVNNDPNKRMEPTAITPIREFRLDCVAVHASRSGESSKLAIRSKFHEFMNVDSKFTAVIRKDGDWWVGWVEEIPGVNAQETTREGLLESLGEALKDILELNRMEARKAMTGDYEEVQIPA